MGIQEEVKEVVTKEPGAQLINTYGKIMAFIPADPQSDTKQGLSSEYEIMRGDLIHVLQGATTCSASPSRVSPKTTLQTLTARCTCSSRMARQKTTFYLSVLTALDREFADSCSAFRIRMHWSHRTHTSHSSAFPRGRATAIGGPFAFCPNVPYCRAAKIIRTTFEHA